MTGFKRALLALGVVCGAALALQGCCGSCGFDRAPLTEAQQDYVGSWVDDDGATLTINADGSGAYHSGGGGVNKRIDGGTVTIEGKNLKIALFGIEQAFTIDEEPDDGKMVLSGQTFTRQ